MEAQQIDSVQQSSSRTSNFTNSAQNAAACGQPNDIITSRSHMDSSNAGDSKRNIAALLAQQLASTASWSETFVSPTYDAGPTSSMYLSRPVDNNRETGVMSNHIADEGHNLDPPPAYSPPQPHELPATPVPYRSQPAPSTHSETRRANDLDNRTEQGTPDDSTEEEPHDPESPLLGDRRCRRRNRLHSRNGKGRHRRGRRLCCMIVLILIISLLAGAIASIFTREVWSKAPVKPSQSLVPTGPTYERHETIEHITGAYKLYDKLELTTTAGSISIEIDPQPGEHPAELVLSTDLGDIFLNLSPNYLARQHKVKRAIHTEIRSLTGTISAEILLGGGGHASVVTATGMQIISVRIYDLGAQDTPSNLTTYSHTGGQKIHLIPLETSKEEIVNLVAEHHSFAIGDLDLLYPDLWHGDVSAMASVGEVKVAGDNLNYIKNSEHEVVAYRGTAKVRQKINLLSDGVGRINFNC